MERIQLLFSTGRNPMSPMIKMVTWSRWSHVSLIVPKDSGPVTIEALGSKGGVISRDLGKVLKGAKEYEIVSYWVPDASKVYEAAASMLGKPYDWTALFGLWWHRDWQEADSWFCSELIAYAFDKAGYPLFRPEAISRVCPGDIYKLNPNMTSGWNK